MVATRRKALQMLAVLAAFGTDAAQALEYPTKPVRIVVPYPAGGFNDTLGRLAAKYLSDYWKKPVIVDNKPGAGTMIGTKEVAGAAADGHTILVVQFPYAANPWLYKNIAYDTQKAFAPVLLAGRSPMLLVTHAQGPYRSAAELLAAARIKPNALTYGSSGAGSSNHLAMALFETATATQMRQIPYKGSTPMLTDLAGGQFDVALDLLPHAMPFMQSGRVRPLAIAAPKRSPLLPDVPTMKEAGVADFVVAVWLGFAVPAGTPGNVVQRFNTEINRISQLPQVRDKLLVQGFEMLPPISVAAARKVIEDDQAFWLPIIKQSGATAE